MRIWLSMAAAGGLLLAQGALAEDGTKGAGWDDSHMRSRYRSVLSTPSPAVKVLGRDLYSKLRQDPDASAPTRVPETLPVASQRAWEPGGPKQRSAAPRTRSRKKSSGILAGRSDGTSGPRQSGSGSSTLRAGVRSRPSR